MADEKPGTVFISEDLADDPYLLTGYFSAHWEATEGVEHTDGPEGVSVDEAIAWGRTQADVVLVRLGDDDFHYSAGTRQPPPVEDDDEEEEEEEEEDFPVWPEHKRVRRRRFRGMEHLDLRSDEPIPWQVRFPRRVSIRHPGRDAELLQSALTRDSDVSEVQCEIERAKDRVDAVFRFRVSARGHEEAMRLVLAIEERSMNHVRYPVEELHGSGEWVTDERDWNPFDDIRPVPPESYRANS